jgi:hypothetical protein
VTDSNGLFTVTRNNSDNSNFTVIVATPSSGDPAAGIPNLLKSDLITGPPAFRPQQKPVHERNPLQTEAV